MKVAARLTKADTVALWHAVANFALMVRQMNSMDFAPDVLAAERGRVAAAKRALRKVNGMRREGVKGGGDGARP